jgi:hypothetical protein
MTVDGTGPAGKQPGTGSSRCAMVAPQTILMTKEIGRSE